MKNGKLPLIETMNRSALGRQEEVPIQTCEVLPIDTGTEQMKPLHEADIVQRLLLTTELSDCHGIFPMA